MSVQSKPVAGANPRRFIRKRELLTMLPFSAATLHRKIKAGEFVRPVKLGPRITAYSLEEVNEWLEKRSDR
jgi:predicted DNA-binding transcriptional regulator AlpA